MINSERTKKFLSVITPEAKALILKSIAKHYRTSVQDIYEEVTGVEAEHLLDYMVGGERDATNILMQKYNLRGF